MKVKLFFKDGSQEPFYALYANEETHETIIGLHNPEQYGYYAENPSILHDVPKKSRIVFYLGDEVVGETELDNNILISTPNRVLSEYFYTESDLSSYFNYNRYNFGEKYFKPLVDDFCCNLEEKIVYGIVNGEFYECRAVLENTIKLGVEGYSAYYFNPSDEVAYHYSEKVDCTELLALNIPYSIGNLSVRYEDINGDIKFTVERPKTLQTALKIFNSKYYKALDYTHGLPVLPLIMEVTLETSEPTEPLICAIDDTVTESLSIRNMTHNKDDIVKEWIRQMLPQVLENTELVPYGENFVLPRTKEIYNIHIINWLDLTFDRIHDVTVNSETGELDFKFKSVDSLSDRYLAMFEEAYFKHDYALISVNR